jgi:hypothetical protein
MCCPTSPRWHPARILESTPSGRMSVVPPKRSFDWEKVRRDVHHVLPRHTSNVAKLAQWDAFIDARPKDLAAAQQVQSLPKLNFACIPPAANVLDDHHAAAVRQVQQNAVVVEAPNMIVSNGVEGSRRRALDARAAGHLVRRPRQRT